MQYHLEMLHAYLLHVWKQVSSILMWAQYYIQDNRKKKHLYIV